MTCCLLRCHFDAIKGFSFLIISHLRIWRTERKDSHRILIIKDLWNCHPIKLSHQV